MKLELPQPCFPEKWIPKKHLLNPCLLWYRSRCWNNKLHGPITNSELRLPLISPHFCGFKRKKDELQSIITYLLLLWNYYPTPMISTRLLAQDTTAAPSCPNFSHGNAGKICPSSGNTLMTSLEKHRLAAFINEKKKAQFSQLANSSNNSNSGLGWCFFPLKQ